MVRTALRRAAAAAALFFLVPLARGGPYRENAADLLEQGRRDARAGQYERAARSLERSKELEPTYAAYMALAGVYREQRRFAEAKRMRQIADDLCYPCHTESIQKGYFALESGDDRRALSLFKSQIARAPEESDGYHHLAQYYIEKGNYDAAEAELRRAVALLEKKSGDEPLSLAHALSKLGFIDRERGRYSDAEDFYGRALRALDAWPKSALYPKIEILVLTRFAELRVLEGQDAGAETLYRRALSETRTSPYPWKAMLALPGLGGILERRSDHAGAERLYRQALELAGRSDERLPVSEALIGLMSVYAAQGRLSEARELRDRILKSLPAVSDVSEKVGAYLAVADAALMSRDERGAARFVDAARKLAGRLVGYERAMRLREIARRDAALGRPRAAAPGPGGEDPGTLIARAERDARAGRYERAAGALERAKDLEPSYAAYMALAGVYRRQRRFADAKRMRQIANDLCAFCYNEYIQKGYFAMEAGDDSRALRLFKLQVARAPDDPNGHHHLGQYYMQAGDYAAAEAEIRRSIALLESMPNKETLLLAHSIAKLGSIYRQRGKYADAEAYYRRALRVVNAWPKSPRYPKIEMLLLTRLAELYVLEGRDGGAEPLYLRMLAEERTSRFSWMAAVSLTGLGGILERRGEYPEAERAYRQVLSRAEAEAGDPPVSGALIGLAGVYGAQGRVKDARELRDRALKGLPGTRDFAEKAGILLACADVSFLERDARAGFLFLDAARKLVSRAGPSERASFLEDLAKRYAARGRGPDARELGREAALLRR